VTVKVHDPDGGGLPPPQTLGVPPPPQVWGEVQVPQELTVREAPQLSVPVTEPQFLPRRVQKAVLVSGVHIGGGVPSVGMKARSLVRRKRSILRPLSR
jgi:hypothetical protein